MSDQASTSKRSALPQRALPGYFARPSLNVWHCGSLDQHRLLSLQQFCTADESGACWERPSADADESNSEEDDVITTKPLWQSARGLPPREPPPNGQLQHLQAAQGHIVGAAHCPFRDVGHYHICKYLLLVQTRVRVRKMTTIVILTHNLWRSARGLPPRNQLRSLIPSGHPLEARRCARSLMSLCQLLIFATFQEASRAIGILILQTAVSHVPASPMT